MRYPVDGPEPEDDPEPEDPTPSSSPAEFEELLRRVREDGKITIDELFAAMYAEIHRMAQGIAAAEGASRQVQATELINEAYLKIRDLRGHAWHDRGHFIRTVARAARRALIEEARRRKALKRGGGMAPESLFTIRSESPITLDRFIALNDALDRMRRDEEGMARQADIIDLYWFMGLNVVEIANILGLSERQVRRDHRFARAWLRDQIGI